MQEELFSDFSPVSAKQWKQKIQADLKGADYNETLLTPTYEGIDIKPFYHQDDFIKLKIDPPKNPASICQEIFVSDAKVANSLAKDALNKGAETIYFEAHQIFDSNLLLKQIDVEVFIKIRFIDLDFIESLYLNHKDIKLNICIDIIGHFAETGNWFKNESKDFEILKDILSEKRQHQNLISIQTDVYQNAGANCVQQVAYALAHGNEYLHALNATLNKSCFHFHFAVGGNYFMEIAKLRAFRYLWSLITDQYELNIPCKIIASPSLRNKTIYDYNVNMLRSTTECMSAFLGGVDVIINRAYDSVYHRKNEFGERIARNQLIILKEESYFKSANKIAEGSYYIETLSAEIANKSWAVFQSIEKGGGFLQQLKTGTIQRKIQENAKIEQDNFNDKKQVLLGTNAHPNATDQMKGELELYPFVKKNTRKTIIQPIIPKRLAEELEQERLKSEEQRS